MWNGLNTGEEYREQGIASLAEMITTQVEGEI
jgi:hypothetical protein